MRDLYRVIFPLAFFGSFLDLVLLVEVFIVESNGDDDDCFVGLFGCCCCCRRPRVFFGMYAFIVAGANFWEGDGLVDVVAAGPFSVCLRLDPTPPSFLLPSRNSCSRRLRVIFASNNIFIVRERSFWNVRSLFGRYCCR